MQRFQPLSFFQELNRRNVYRVALAYAVISWLVLQVADVVVPILALQPWVGKLVFLMLAAGLPVAQKAILEADMAAQLASYQTSRGIE